MIINICYRQFVKLQSNLTHIIYTCAVNVCALIYASAIMSVKSTITIESDFKLKNIAILVKFLGEVLIWTSDHHVPFV